MNEKEATEQLNEILSQYEGDPEMMHVYADYVLVDFLRDNGFEELVKSYEKCMEHFWYA